MGAKQMKERGWFILYTLLPAVITLMLITLLPFIINIINSLRDYYLASPTGPEFVGFLNYYTIFFQDKNFRHAFFITFLFVVSTVGTQFFLGLAIASLINKNESGFSRFVQGTLMLPLAATPIAMAFIWRLMYNPTLGIINYFTGILHLPQINWLSEPATALISLIIADTWQWTPFMMLILLAGLKALPVETYEAAKVDGASPLQSFIYITFPLLRPVAMIAILFRFIDSFKTFDIIFIITRGGPGNATETLNMYTFLKGFSYLRMGYASALAIIMLIIVIIISMFLIKLSELEEEGRY